MSARAPDFDEPSALLPTAPPARAARAAGRLLLLLAVAGLLFATLVPLPELARAPFELVTDEAADALQSPLAGELVAVHVREGERVAAGQVLFELTHADLRARQSQARQLREQRDALAARVAAAERVHAEGLAIVEAERAAARRALEFLKSQVATQRELLARAERLGERGVVAEAELLRYRLALAEAEKERVVGEREVERLQLAARQRESERAQARAAEDSELRLLEERAAALALELEDSADSVRRVRAPFDAIVLRLPARTPGAVLGQGEVLAQLARIGAGLKARIDLPDELVARVATGMPIRLEVSAWPWQRHGSVPATLAWVSPTPVAAADGRRFVADAELGASALELRAGMRGEARIVHSRRTLWQRALDPLRAAGERWR